MNVFRNIDWMRLIPRYWLQNEPTCLWWDKELNELLDKQEVEPLDEFTCKVGNLEVWIANWPYSYGYAYNPKYPYLPKVNTRLRLRKMIKEKHMEVLK